MTKRLFLFSIYSRLGVIDDYVLYYLKALTKCGDVILCADNNDYDESLERIQKEIPTGIKAMLAFKHGEYDFGSYKYCLKKAQELGIDKDYDYLYLCNDSVIGPLTELGPILDKLEEGHPEVVSMYKYLRKTLSGPQSWFVGFYKNRHAEIAKFLKNVTKEDHKDDVVLKYEHGLGKYVEGWTDKALVSIDGLNNFFEPVEFFEEYPDYPFLKKRAICYVGTDSQTYRFLKKVIKDPTLAQSTIDLIPSILAHEKTMAPKYRGVSIIRLTGRKYLFKFVIPPVDPKKKKEQQYF